MAEAVAGSAVGRMHQDCPTCACGKRAPVQPGGSIAWEEHEAVWSISARALALTGTVDDVAQRGGFTIGEITQALGHEPRTWRAVPAQRVEMDYVEVYEDDAGEFRWRRKNGGNHEEVADSNEGYETEQWAATMAQRVNPNCEIKVLSRKGRAAPDPATANRPAFPQATGPAQPGQPLGQHGASGEGYIDNPAPDAEPRAAVDESDKPLDESSTAPEAAPLDGPAE